jgi:aminopeptidase N
LERDNTAAGQEQATTLRTALPSAEAKAAAWDQLMNDTTLPNRIVEALLVGFAEPDQRELARAYVTPYFENVLNMWDSRTHEIGSLLATLLYPAVLVEESVVTATDEFLAAHTDLPTGLRRILAEQRDSLLRALRAVAVDRG